MAACTAIWRMPLSLAIARVESPGSTRSLTIHTAHAAGAHSVGTTPLIHALQLLSLDAARIL